MAILPAERAARHGGGRRGEAMTSTALGQLPELCERLRPALEIILASYQVPFQDGEDLVQTTLLIAVTQWETIRSPRDWLPATLRNRCRIYWRERRLHERRQVPLEAWTREPATRPAQERCEALLDLDTLCRRLPARQRDVLCRSRLWNMKPADVARATGLAPASVRKTVHRAIAHLRWEARKAVPPRRRCRRAPRDPRPAADVERWAFTGRPHRGLARSGTSTVHAGSTVRRRRRRLRRD